MKILIADQFPAVHLGRMIALGHEVVYDPSLEGARLLQKMTDANALVVRTTKVTADAILRAKVLRLIIRGGTGVDNIDMSAAKTAGVVVKNTPGKNAASVAELTFGLMLALDRKIPASNCDLKKGLWNRSRYLGGMGLAGRSLGVIGIGHIGRAVAERAAAFGMFTHAYVRPESRNKYIRVIEELGLTTHPSLNTLAESCDVISIHTPLNALTLRMLGYEFFEAMKPGSILINTSRSEIIDPDALLWAMDNKSIFAGLDVHANEPEEDRNYFNSLLVEHPNTYCTHHIGASSEQAQLAVAEGVIDAIQDFEQSYQCTSVH